MSGTTRSLTGRFGTIRRCSALMWSDRIAFPVPYLAQTAAAGASIIIWEVLEPFLSGLLFAQSAPGEKLTGDCYYDDGQTDQIRSQTRFDQYHCRGE